MKSIYRSMFVLALSFFCSEQLLSAIEPKHGDYNLPPMGRHQPPQQHSHFGSHRNSHRFQSAHNNHTDASRSLCCCMRNVCTKSPVIASVLGIGASSAVVGGILYPIAEHLEDVLLHYISYGFLGNGAAFLTAGGMLWFHINFWREWCKIRREQEAVGCEMEDFRRRHFPNV